MRCTSYIYWAIIVVLANLLWFMLEGNWNKDRFLLELKITYNQWILLFVMWLVG